jgi:cytidyltransferase-like protein
MEVVVYTKIVGDIFHPGHVKFLKTARALGDKLVVQIVPDDRVQAYKRKPTMTQAERAEVIASCRYVDEVQLSGPKQITLDFMNMNGYNIYAYGFSSENEAAAKRRDCIELPHDRIFIIPYSHGISTTDIISRIKNGEHKS